MAAMYGGTKQFTQYSLSYKMSFKRRAWMIAHLFKISFNFGVMSRCVCNRMRASSLSSFMLRIAVAVLSHRLNVRSGLAVVTGNVARICSRTLILGRVSP